MATIKPSITMQPMLFEQVQMLAQQLGVTPERLVELALEDFIQRRPEPAAQNPPPPVRADIRQGDVYWVPLSQETEGAESGYPHPHVVIQEDVLNHSRIHSVVVCALTSNLKRISAPGNVLLAAGEANLPKPSVVVVSQVSTVDKAQLGAYIGSLSKERVQQILAGMQFLQSFTRPLRPDPENA